MTQNLKEEEKTKFSLDMLPQWCQSSPLYCVTFTQIKGDKQDEGFKSGTIPGLEGLHKGQSLFPDNDTDEQVQMLFDRTFKLRPTGRSENTHNNACCAFSHGQRAYGNGRRCKRSRDVARMARL